MKRGFLGLDIGSISTKCVVIDENNEIIWERYIWTEGNPTAAIRSIFSQLSMEQDRLEITAIGTTGSARRLAGAMLQANVVKNEITAHAIGTLSRFKDVRTIFEIGGQDSKIILIENGVVVDYGMNTLCAAGTGAFLTSQATRLGLPIEEFGEYALRSKRPCQIAARCTVFAESDLVHKAQIGYAKEDIIAGLCNAVARNFLSNLCKGKTIKPPIVFQGGVSKNLGVVRAFENERGKILVDEKGHLMGALGAAILAKDSVNMPKMAANESNSSSNINSNPISRSKAMGKNTSEGYEKSVRPAFDFSLLKESFETKGCECNKCDNRCELISIYRSGKLIDIWGSRCGQLNIS